MLVREAWGAYRSDVDYGINVGLAQDLRKIVALIDARMPARFYYCGYRGNSFDTHVHQVDVHARLLAYATDAIRGFVDDVERIGRADDVLVLVFTEFGRRVPENISLGTDHGTATPVSWRAHGSWGPVWQAPEPDELDDGNRCTRRLPPGSTPARSETGWARTPEPSWGVTSNRSRQLRAPDAGPVGPGRQISRPGR